MTTSVLDVEGFQRRWDEIAAEVRAAEEFDPRSAREQVDEWVAELEAQPAEIDLDVPPGAVLLPEHGDHTRTPMTIPAMLHRVALLARLALVVAVLALFAAPWLNAAIFHWVVGW